MDIDKKLTRKQFLLSGLSIVAIFFASKVPLVAKNFIIKKEGNTYGNYSYGGNNNKKNV